MLAQGSRGGSRLPCQITAVATIITLLCGWTSLLGGLFGPLKWLIGGLSPFEKGLLSLSKGLGAYLRFLHILLPFFWAGVMMFFLRAGSPAQRIYGFPLPKALVKTLAKSLIINLAKNLGRVVYELEVRVNRFNRPFKMLLKRFCNDV